MEFNKEILRKRVGYFFSTDRRNRKEVHDFVKNLELHGFEVAIFGGMLRDLLLIGNRKFKSDVDLVVKGGTGEKFQKFLTYYWYKTNNFGGYDISLKNWKVGVFRLEETWAKMKGYIEVSQFKDLVNTTFFSCDAIVYNLTKDEIHTCDGYFQNFYDGVIEINLDKFINPVNHVIRAFRYKEKFGFEFGENLSYFLDKIIDEYGLDFVIHDEKERYGTNYIENFYRDLRDKNQQVLL